MITKILVLGACAVLLPQAATGQQTDTFRAERCRHSLSAVQGNAAAAERAQALRYLSACGADGAIALAAELRRHRNGDDSGPLLTAYAAMAELRDAGILQAALDVAGDRAASDTTRIIAFKVLIAYHRPWARSLPVSHFLPGTLPDLTVESDAEPTEGAPLPADWREDASSLMERIAADPAEGDTMRHAAHRALMIFR